VDNTTASSVDIPWWFAGGVNNTGRFADFSSNAVRIAEGNRQTAAGIENLLDQNQFEATNANLTSCCNRVVDGQVSGEFRMSDRLRDIEREMNANAREAAKCCCDLKLQACEDKAELKAEILAVETRGIQRDLDTANRQLSESNIINALKSNS
jgi:hypothetical protein